jgi:hypothetical protein
MAFRCVIHFFSHAERPNETLDAFLALLLIQPRQSRDNPLLRGYDFPGHSLITRRENNCSFLCELEKLRYIAKLSIEIQEYFVALDALELNKRFGLIDLVTVNLSFLLSQYVTTVLTFSPPDSLNEWKTIGRNTFPPILLRFSQSAYPPLDCV